MREFAANPVLVGKVAAAGPEHRGSMQVVYTQSAAGRPRLLDSGIGMQFDDDLNVRTVPGLSEPGLPGYTVASFTASRSVGRNFEAFFGVQNIFDEEYFVGTLPTTVGSPRLVTGGVRVQFAGRPQTVSRVKSQAPSSKSQPLPSPKFRRQCRNVQLESLDAFAKLGIRRILWTWDLGVVGIWDLELGI